MRDRSWETKTHCPFFYIPLISLSFADQTSRKHNALYFLNAPRSSHEVKNAKARGENATLGVVRFVLNALCLVFYRRGTEDAKLRGDFYSTQRFSAYLPKCGTGPGKLKHTVLSFSPAEIRKGTENYTC